MKVSISAIGTANPAYKLHQSEAVELIAAGLQLKPAEKRLLKSIYKSSGIEYRHSVLNDFAREPVEPPFYPRDSSAPFPATSKRMQVYKENALNLAIAAIENCIATLENFELTQITHLITVSCTGMYAPGIDIEIVQKLKMNSSTKRTAVNFMGCYGAFNALKLADSICQADHHAKVMVVCVELCSLHFQQNASLDHIVSNAIFADGAAAVLVEFEPSTTKYFSLEQFHCDLLPQSSKEMAWHISDSGFDIALSTYVPSMIESGIAEFVLQLLRKNHLQLSDLDLFAIHPGGVKILQACEGALGISSEQNQYAYRVLKNYGNMSSATVLFVLKEMLNDLNDQHHGKNVLVAPSAPV